MSITVHRFSGPKYVAVVALAFAVACSGSASFSTTGTTSVTATAVANGTSPNLLANVDTTQVSQVDQVQTSTFGEQTGPPGQATPVAPTTLTSVATSSEQEAEEVQKVITSIEFNSESDLAGLQVLDNDNGGAYNSELQTYFKDQVTVNEDGHLQIVANQVGGHYRSGMVMFGDALVLSQGESLVARLQINSAGGQNGAAGLWPALWATEWLEPHVGWPAGGEVDLFEAMFGDSTDALNTSHRRALMSVHYQGFAGSNTRANRRMQTDAAFPASNSTWSQSHLESTEPLLGRWIETRLDYGTDGSLTFFLDGQQMFSVNPTDVKSDPNPFTTDISNWRVNLAVGGDMFDTISSDAFPAALLVDYVRIVQQP